MIGIRLSSKRARRIPTMTKAAKFGKVLNSSNAPAKAIAESLTTHHPGSTLDTPQGDEDFSKRWDRIDEVIIPAFASDAETIKAFETTIGKHRVRHQQIPVAQIEPDPNQPRKTFDQDSISDLALSISDTGLQQPIGVRSVPATGRYTLIFGERRWRAVSSLGSVEITAIVFENVSSLEVRKLQIQENLQRKEFDALQGTLAVLDQVIIELPDIIVRTPTDGDFSPARRDLIRLLYRMNVYRARKQLDKIEPQHLETIDRLFRTVAGMKWSSFINNRSFLLNMPDDLHRASLKGIEVSRLKIVNKLNAKALGVPETQAKEFRGELLSKIKGMSVVELEREVERISQSLGKGTCQDLAFTETVGAARKALRKLRSRDLSTEDREKLESAINTIRSLVG